MKIIISQVKKCHSFATRSIEIHLDTNEGDVVGNWEYKVKQIYQSIDHVLYPEYYDENYKQDSPTDF